MAVRNVTQAVVHYVSDAPALFLRSLAYLFEMALSPFIALLHMIQQQTPPIPGAPVGFENTTGSQCWFNALLHLVMSDERIKAWAAVQEGGDWARVHAFFQAPHSKSGELMEPLGRLSGVPIPPGIGDASDLMPLIAEVPGVYVQYPSDLRNMGVPDPESESEWISLNRRGEGGILDTTSWPVPLLWNGTHELDSFACHTLTDHLNGHWIAYAKRKGRWFECNDKWVRPVTESYVQERAGTASLFHFSRLPLQ